MDLMLVHTELLVSAFQDVWCLFFSVLEFQIWLTYTWFASLCCVFFVAVYFYWFYMCRHCSLSCEIHLVNNMTMFWNVNFIFLLSHFIWKHCSKMCMYKCNPCWASNVDNQKKKILLLFCRLLFNALCCIIILQKLSNL